MPVGQTATTALDGGPRFSEVARSAGLDYRWTIAGKRPLNILQTIGNGCAFLDYDNDGNLDILLVGPKLGLFRGDGHGHFTDVTKATGLDKLSGHFLGCAIGDYDNDGFDDIYVSGYRTGLLLHNESAAGGDTSNGGRRFRAVTREMGLPPQPWGTSCAFADVDGDGFLDLYICNYVRFDPSTDLVLCPYHGVMTGCGPKDYDAEFGVLYHNDSGRRFRDVTREWGARGHGKSLGVAFSRFESSTALGFAVANDLNMGDLFRPAAPHKFKNVGRESGTGADETGSVHAGMGIDWGDYDNDGRPDLFVTTFGNETKCLYHNDGEDAFSMVSTAAGIENPTLPYVGWGCKFVDVDNDGWLDLVMANGHVQDNIARFEHASYRQPTVLLRNSGIRPPRFADVTKRAGLGSLPPIVGRGVAVGDYDNDGRMDIIVVDSEGRPLLLHNDTVVAATSWIGFKLAGRGRSNRDGYGAVIRVVAGDLKLVRQCHADGSYLSSSDSRVHFGLGRAALQVVTVWWPDGIVQSWTNLEPGRYYTLLEGQDPR